MDRRTFHCLFPVSPKPTTEIPQSEYLGTHVTLQEVIRRQAHKELGINIEFYPGGDAESPRIFRGHVFLSQAASADSSCWR